MEALKIGSKSSLVTIEFEDAQRLTAGYAFGTRALQFKELTPKFGELPPSPRVRRWGYRSFDCVSGSAGPGLQTVDLLVVSGLNVDVDIESIESFNAVKDAVSESVGQIESGGTFWGLTSEEIHAGTESDPTNAWWLDRAWWLLMSTPGVGATITHKVLHHKWPHLFPLLDRKTLAVYPRGGAWAGVHADISSQAEAFSLLEEWFKGLAGKQGGVALTRLRLHDILLWSNVTEWDAECIEAGRAFVK